MSDTTRDPDETGAIPADEGDTTETPTTADAAADVPAEKSASTGADDVADAASEPEPVAAPEPVADAAAETPEAPPVLDEPAFDTAADAEAARTARLDEAVQRANAGAPASEEPLVTASEPTTPVEAVHGEPVYAEPVDADLVDAEVAPEPLPVPVAADSVRRETYVPPAPEAVAAAGGAATLAAEPVPVPAPQPQTIYVQAPVPPKKQGNRGFGVLVAAIGAVAFAVLYAAVAYLLLLGRGDNTKATDVFVSFLGSAVFWVPLVAVFLGFAVLAAIVNRGPWWVYAVFGLLVGVFVYFSYIGAALLTVQAWTLTYDEAMTFIAGRWLDPFAIAAAVIAREIPIWFGGWIAAHGRTVTERNRLAREAYDRELAAGPRPVA
ncbi:hypothetical protein [Agromyces sp. Marseille-Q5079]|uniref:hypothetical protein n=1 Tax=Agromyces sp. Marseille-Q5079 TaxID=3439059 RepID=UPI003D9C7E1F